MELDFNSGKVAYKTQLEYSQENPQGTNGEIIEGESMTVPGDHQSVQEIMKRAMTGIPVPFDNSQYFDEENLDNIRRYPVDFTDLDEARRELQRASEALEEAIRRRDNPDPEPDPEPDPTTDPEPDPTPDPTP